MSIFSIVESIHGTSKKPRAIQQWEEISYSNTQKVTQLGSNVPLAWVLVHGKNIPPNAIVAGEDKRRPLFIARTFWEGGVHIGQAGQHLERGASFAYLGREIHVDTYEVLVPLQQTVTYHISDSHSISNIPRIHRSNDLLVDASILQKLRSVKTVMVIDDSMSMIGTLWSQARAALTGLVSMIESDFDARGIDLCFLNNPTFETNIKDRHRIQNIFDSVAPTGETPSGRKLQEIFNRYLPILEDPINGKNSPPIIVMVITDGVPTDDVVPVVVEGARRLDRKEVPLHSFGISFVQIGDDPDAAEYLRELDDDISSQHGCRDIVDSTPFDPQCHEFTREVLLKCVLGAIDPLYDSIQCQPHADLKKDPRSQFNSPLGLPLNMHSPAQSLLVHPTPPITYHISDSHSISNIHRIHRSNDSLVDVSILRKLRTVKTVLVIDDSMSMIGTLWSQARAALMGLVSMIESDFDARGIDLCFLNNPTFETNIKHRHRVQSIFDSVVPTGETPCGRKLQEIFNRYLPILEDPINGKNSPPIIVMVITDGVSTDDVVPVVVEGARRLNRKEVPLHSFGISFVQIGDDPGAAEYLRVLDDDISSRHECRDIVDTTPFDPQYHEFTREVLLKCILGAIDPFYDSIQNQPHADLKKGPRSQFNSPVGLPLNMHSPAQSLLMYPTPPMPTPFNN